MNFEKLTTSQQALLEILSCAVRGEKFKTNKELNWQNIFEESKLQSVALQVFDTIDSTADFDKNEWALYSFGSLRSNFEIHNQHAYLHNLMTKNNIDYVVLKGSASAFYYPNPKLRTMGDVDFLIKESEIEKASKALIDDGFVLVEQDHICHIVFKKGKMHFEMHFTPPGLPEGKNGEAIKEYFDNVFKLSCNVKIEDYKFVIPGDFHHGLTLLMHTYHHLLSEGIGLRHLCDWAVFVDSFDSKEFENLFKQKLETVGLWNFAKILSYLSHLYLKIPYKEFMGKFQSKLCEDLMCDIISGGNFGRKDKKRAEQGVAISNRGKNGVNKSSIIQFISNCNNASISQFPILKKVKILRPFGWLMLVIRRTFRVIFGKRKMPQINDILTEANKRKELYKNFHLFETEDNHEN